MNDPLYEACHSFLSNRHTVLWSDFDLTRPDRREKAAAWLAAQIQGVAEHYDVTAPPFFQTAADAPLTGPPSGEFNPLTVLEDTLRQDPSYTTTPRQRP